jgi:hypothetical protein
MSDSDKPAPEIIDHPHARIPRPLLDKVKRECLDRRIPVSEATRE